MRDEDLDWCCYIFLSRRAQPASPGEVAEGVGIPEEIVRASIDRLVHALLVSFDGERARVMSVQESLLACQLRYAGDLPFVLENGVVRARRADDT
ncbi:MAG TPA: MarR family transcriptional regulator [Methanoregulaceae archaeon]|nr:MarR family transcriptional regulator [Methanoregulaceae archaeon]